MCRAKSEGGRRCTCDWRERSEATGRRILHWEAIVQERQEAYESASEAKKPALAKKILRAETRVQRYRQRLEETLYAMDRTGAGIEQLKREIADPRTPDDDREVARARLARVQKERAAENRFFIENKTKIENTIRAMEQAGFSEEDRTAITERFLARGFNRLPYSSAEAEAEKREVVLERRAFLKKVNALKAEVDADPDLDEQEKQEAKWEIEGEFSGQMGVLNERLRLAKIKYDATPAGLAELQAAYRRKVAEGDIYLAAELRARADLAEKEIRVRADERNARAALRRAVIKAAKKAGADPEAVWSACKTVEPVNADGTAYRIAEPSDVRRKAPRIRITSADYEALVADVRAMPEFAGVPENEAVKTRAYRRIISHPAVATGTGVEQKQRIRAGEKRDKGLYPNLTVKEFQRVASLAESLGMHPAVFMRSMALKDADTPLAIGNQKAQRDAWAKKVSTSEART